MAMQIVKTFLKAGTVVLTGILFWLAISLLLYDDPKHYAGKLAEDWQRTHAEPPGLAGNYLASRYARRNKDMHNASDFMLHLLEEESTNEALMEEALELFVSAGDMQQAIALAIRMQKAQIDDSLIALVLLGNYVKINQFDQAAVLLESASDGGLFDMIKPALVRWVRLGAGDEVLPLDMSKEIEESGFFSSFMHYQAGLINDILGDSDAAIRHYELSSKDPQARPYRLIQIMANHYMRQGEAEKAKALYDDYMARNPHSHLVPGHSVMSNEMEIGNAADGIAEVFYTTASLLFGESASTDTFIYLQLALYLKPDFPVAQLMLANLYESAGSYEKAIATYEKIEEGNVFYERGKIRIALNYEALDQPEKALEMLHRLARERPDDPEPLITMGDILRSQKEFEKAAAAYDEALKRSEPISLADWPVLYARGICYERIGEWDKAEADFLQALELERNQPDVLNYLGYSWLIKEMHIERALEMIALAIEQRPHDAHIIDSMGWAKYHLGEYEEALVFLEKATQLAPQDPVINDHLGDVYWRLGRKIEARFQWERALVFDPEPEDRKKIEHKLEHGLEPLEIPEEIEVEEEELVGDMPLPPLHGTP